MEINNLFFSAESPPSKLQAPRISTRDQKKEQASGIWF